MQFQEASYNFFSIWVKWQLQHSKQLTGIFMEDIKQNTSFRASFIIYIYTKIQNIILYFHKLQQGTDGAALIWLAALNSEGQDTSHIKAWTKWPSFCKIHFKMQCFEWNSLYFD